MCTIRAMKEKMDWFSFLFLFNGSANAFLARNRYLKINFNWSIIISVRFVSMNVFLYFNIHMIFFLSISISLPLAFGTQPIQIKYMTIIILNTFCNGTSTMRIRTAAHFGPSLVHRAHIRENNRFLERPH